MKKSALFTRTGMFYSLFGSFLIYSLLIYSYSAPESSIEPMSENAIEGKAVWQKYNCISCHQIYGLGGYMGPDITNVISDKGEDFTRVLVKYGSGRMPAFPLSDKDVDDLIAYFHYLDKTGTSPVKDYEITWYGSIKLKDR
jgi:nitric oxide reductase subunit C